MKKAKSKAKREIAKVVKNFFNQCLTSTTKYVVVKLKSIFDKMIARVAANKIKLTQLEKKNEIEAKTKTKTKTKKQKKHEKQELNLNEKLSALNIMNYFYLSMTRSFNVNETNYISFFRSEADLERRFQYQFSSLSFSSSLSTQQVEISLSSIVYEHEYIEAEACDMQWRMKHSWMNEMNLTKL